MDADPAGLILQIFILFVLIGVNAFFVLSEIAIITLKDAELEQRAANGDRKALSVKKLISDKSRFFSTVQIGVTLAGFLTSAKAALTFSDMLTALLQKTPLEEFAGNSFVKGLSVIIVTLVIAYITLVLGELVPKKIGMQRATRIAYKVAGVLNAFYSLTKPVVNALTWSSKVVVKLLGFDPDADEETVSEQVILMQVDEAVEKGVMEEFQRDMIEGIFEMDDINAADVMTHRMDMVSIHVDSSLAELVKLADEEGHSRIPVYDEDFDDIVGIVYIKDLLGFIGKEITGQRTVRDVMRPPYCIPDTKRCSELFFEMQGGHTQFAVVVDEKGGTSGVITMEDILEEVVGNIQDEYDNEEEEVTAIDETTYEVDGGTKLDELVEELEDWGLIFPEDDYDTLGGFILFKLGYIPEDGQFDSIVHDNLRYTILNMDERRVGRVKIERMQVEE